MVSKTAAEAATLLDANGYLKSRYQAMIGTKIAGRVEQMCVEEGMKVKKGDTLAVIEHNDLKAMLASREAQALRTAAELEEARADLWEKEREDRRVSRLFAQRSATPEESEKAQAGHKKATARVAALEAAVKLMKANVEEIKATIVTMHLYAPFDGTVVEKQGEVGEIISPTAMSSSLGRTAVVTIANLEKMDVETEIHESNLLSRIALGQPADGVRQRDSVQAVPRPAAPGVPDERPDAKHASRSRSRSSTPTTSSSPSWRPRFTSCAASRSTARTRAAPTCSCPSRPSSGRTGTTSSGSSAKTRTLASSGSRWRSTTDDAARVESGLKLNDAVVLEPDRKPFANSRWFESTE